MTAEWRQRTDLTRKALANAMQLPTVARAFGGAVETMQLLIDADPHKRTIERQLRVDIEILTDETRSSSPVLARTWGSELGTFMEAWVAWQAFEDRGDPERARGAFALRAPTEMAALMDLVALRGRLGVRPPGGRPAGSGETPDSFAAKLANAYNDARRATGGPPTQEQVAAKLGGTNVRTLRKWLDANGVSWRDFMREREALGSKRD
jgi:hypothetical protein